MTKQHIGRRGGRIGLVIAGLCLLGIATVSVAQRVASTNLFRGIWSGTLTPDVIFGAPAEDVARLSQPVDFELRVFARGRAELQFISDNDEWEFTGREMQITEIGQTGVIVGRLSGSTDRSQQNFSFQLTKVDDETLLVNWSKISTREDLRFDGLDELAFGGVDELTLDD